MKHLKSHFKFNKQERSGIFFLLLLLVFSQIGYFIYKNYAVSGTASIRIDVETQAKISLLKKNTITRDTIKIYPFNPNFITDYKGYTLGLSIAEIDRLHAFRANNTYVNSSEEFQKVTMVSDSLLEAIAPYFKFPNWVSNQTKEKKLNKKSSYSKTKAGQEITDLNTATAEDLKAVNGIGEVLAGRIIKFRDRLGGFLLDDQLSDVYGLKPEVVERVLLRFRVLNIPVIEKMDINEATAEELAELVYIQKNVAYAIVAYRRRNGGIDSFDELLQIETFPADRINRIALYLSLKN